MQRVLSAKPHGSSPLISHEDDKELTLRAVASYRRRIDRTRSIPFRWWIAVLLFASTTINYIDRQTLNVLAPYLKRDFNWSNSDFAVIVIAFRAAYTIFQVVAGRLIDRLGTRRGLSVAVLWYSLVAMATSAASGLKSFVAFRFLLGAGEAANWPGATKAVSEWFPESERGLAVATFDSGSAIGGAIAPLLVVWLYRAFGSWRPAFVITGLLGFVWLAVWRSVHRSPGVSTGSPTARVEDKPICSWTSLLRQRNTWGIVLGKALTDPVWFFIADWFAIYLVSKGFRLEQTLLGFWLPFLAADLGNLAGGSLSSYCIRRGWPVLRARKLVVVIGGIGMTVLVPTIWVSSLGVLIALFAVSTFSYAAWSTMGLTFPADLYPSGTVATVSGMSGAAAGIGTILSTFAIGKITDRYSFAPVLIGASILPVLATALVLVLIRDAAAENGTWSNAGIVSPD
jgi:ACS family hexuronate transporter-like MFS transporter